MAFALVPSLPAHLGPPAVVAPAPREVSFGRVAGTAAPGTRRIVVTVNGTAAAERTLDRARFELTIPLPPRDSAVRVVAFDALGNRAARSVQPVFGLPHSARPRPTRSYEDPVLARRLRNLAESFPGIAAVYVENLRTGAGAAWNARARFPAASTVKIGIAIEVLRVLKIRPPPGSSLGRLLSLMLIHSDNAASNALLSWLGGSDAAGATDVNRTLARLGLGDTHLYGGFLVAAPPGPPIPLSVESQPSFSGKYTTAFDLAELHRFLHLAAGDRGPLLQRRLGGAFTGGDARFLLYLLAHSADHGKLDRFLGGRAVVPHKAGWISEARHDSGLVYAPDAALVASVLTWTGAGAGEPADVLAGRVAREALGRFRRTRDASALLGAFSFRL